MNTKPTATLVEMHVAGLGFDMDRRGKKDCIVLVEPRILVPQNQLSLSYYAVKLGQFMFHEGLLA
jgi:hypothetical protein